MKKKFHNVFFINFIRKKGEVITQTNIMNAMFMSTLFLTNIFLCAKNTTELENYAIPTIEYGFTVLDGINPRSKYDLVALIQSYNYSYDKISLYRIFLVNMRVPKKNVK